MSNNNINRTAIASSQTYAPWLWLLIGLFAMRVIAQPLSLMFDLPFLPTFESWHGGVLPYPVLLGAQLLILTWQISTALQFKKGIVVPSRSLGLIVLIVAGLYFGAMLMRLILGFTILSAHRWFSSPLPAIFHLVLASYLMLYGHFHFRHGNIGTSLMRNLRNLFSWLHYPIVMVSVFVIFTLLQSHGFSLTISTYLPIVFAATLITLLEFEFPYRAEWRPSKDELKVDIMFMAIVQLALPPLVSFTFVLMLIEPARALGLPFIELWPHTWPVWGQALLMLLLVDFLRYWLHRAAHTYSYLWRLHSVHHSVEQLYWLNTSRFHPLEKVLQMCLDSLPFLLMAVDKKVLALYYIAYASNGFLQHSNIQMRFGVLNYITGTAELHRWHHSREPKESNANYGNNLIIWDILFRTWYLPKGRNIEKIGLLESAYPKTFIGQMRAPFRQR